ncbi:flavin reductase family protein [Nocardioides campestrisoli]|uniref:flavin reductase family protein n=1 Tax=Nocardioides campestrisoli TaxID=2736757 RepID=UPI0015E710E1|nr:flavin reductase [Nocardioides campestrisoli]
MTIHTSHPFATPEPERSAARRLRGRLGGAVSLWTAGQGDRRAGLTVSSLLVADGEPGRVLGLLDPDADLTEELLATGRGLVHLLRWEHRDLAEVFAGVAPAPGGPFRTGDFVEHPAGPRLTTADGWAAVSVQETTEVGWSTLVTCVLDEVDLDAPEGREEDPLLHRRGRYRRVRATGSGQ